MNYIKFGFDCINYIMETIKIPFPITSDFIPMFSIKTIFWASTIIATVFVSIKFLLIHSYIPTVVEDSQLISNGNEQIQIKGTRVSKKGFFRTKNYSQSVSHRSERRK